MKMNKDRKTNPVKEAAMDFGGQTKMSKLLIMHGIHVHKQTVSQWCLKGSVPYKYKRGLEVLIHNYKRVIRDPVGLLGCVRDPQASNSEMLAPNKELEVWFETQGGISEFVKRINSMIELKNESDKKQIEEQNLKQAQGLKRGFKDDAYNPLEFKPHPKWRYVQIHNWIKRGRVSDNYRSMMEIQFDCPRAIMGPESKRDVPTTENFIPQGSEDMDIEPETKDEDTNTEPTPEDILG